MTAITAAAQTRTLDAIHTHHAQLETAVAAGAVAVRDAAERLADVTPHRAALVDLLQSQVLPTRSPKSARCTTSAPGCPQPACWSRR